ncbi:chaplin [Streptomyces sp. H10-C2]|uniref:chaplin n=1 Tax=unclassified Streptomyces TaxID=2593676 RepID=UPI0024B930B7|nr:MULTISPECIES: chaplin [unclassified Streptomyces]MDJ0344877.1 chaplin [Streptomyces sp. PH10-H1]MDJ0371937.1 chaplin [Streptomyces sp. H10-C2]
MKILKTAAAITFVAGGLAMAGAGVASAHGADAHGVAHDSPGVASGNLVQVPAHVPVNACGNTVSVIGALNPTFGNVCVNK